MNRYLVFKSNEGYLTTPWSTENAAYEPAPIGPTPEDEAQAIARAQLSANSKGVEHWAVYDNQNATVIACG